MGNFEGKNGLNTGEKFYQRLNYFYNAFPGDGTELYVKPVRDFDFAETALYGRVSAGHNSIILNEAYTKNIISVNEGAKSLSAVNFVVDAFQALVQDFEVAALAGRLDLHDPFLVEITAYKAYTPVDVMYSNYIGSLSELFINDFLTSNSNKHIRDFKTFLPLFFEFLKQVATSGPITKTALISSQFCSPEISGLAISISDLDPSDDSQKQSFIESPNFTYYGEICKKHGFYINKQQPWQLIADIGSPFMLQYATRYGLATTDAILRSCYQRAGGEDIANLKRFASTVYNSLTQVKPYVKINYKGSGKRVCRQPIPPTRVDSHYSLNFWIDKYIDIRYIEQREPTSSGAVSSLKKEVGSLLSSKGLKFVLTLINDTFSGFANYEGSFARLSLQYAPGSRNKQSKPTY